MAKRAKRKAARRGTSKGTATRTSTGRSARAAKKRSAARRSVQRPTKKVRRGTKATPRKPQHQPTVAATRRVTASPPRKIPRLDRARRILEEIAPTPPSSLDMDRHGSAARTGRARMAESRLLHKGMSPAITGGDVDVNVEEAYFSGDESPGGDNPTPDQDVVDDIGKALGVEYADSEELKGSDKVVERDRHRWELDPASSEDYRERK